MTPHGFNRLLAMRLAKRRPDGYVQITFSDSPGWSKHVTTYAEDEAVIRSGDNVETMDFRPVFDLPVIVIAEQLGERENRVFLRLQEVASEVVLYVLAWMEQGGELGLCWTRGGKTQAIERAA